MQATAKTAGTRAAARPPATTPECRPRRMLVPAQARDDYYMSVEDTLRASDLGITRHTSDAEIDAIMADTGTAFAGYRDSLLRLRAALRHPRSVLEAVEWGLVIPNWVDPLELADADELNISHRTTDAQLADPALIDRARRVLPEGEDAQQWMRGIRDLRRGAVGENAQELSIDPKKRLGWWWVYDPGQLETLEEREARYLADRRLVDMRGFAAACVRQYATIKDYKHDGDNARRMVENAAFRRQIAREYVTSGATATVEDAEAMLLPEARDKLLKALPPSRMRAGQSDLWYLCDAFTDGRLRTRLDQWYEHHQVKQSGRPKGSLNRNRRPKANT